MTRANALRSPVAAGFVAAVLLLGAAGCGATGETDASGPATDGSIVDPVVEEPTDDTAPDDSEPTDDTTPTDDSEPTADTEPGEPAEACDLLTEEDVAEVFGEPVERGETSDAYECWWSSENDLKTVNLLLSEPDLDEWRGGLENDSWEAVDLGDEGYRGVGMFDTVEFRVGDTVLELNVIYSTSGDADAAVDELAERVAARA